MEKTRVLITVPLDRVDEDRIKAVDPRIEAIYAVDEVVAEMGIKALTPFGRPVAKRMDPQEATQRLDHWLAQTEIIFGWRLPRNLIARSPRLKWVHGMGAGIDLLVGSTGLRQSDVILTNSKGIHGAVISEFVIYEMLMLGRQTRRLFANQAAHKWEPYVGAQLEGKTIGIIGLGTVGRELAGLSHAFGMTVLALDKIVTKREKGTGHVHELFPVGDLLEMLPRCDWVVLTLPLTSETRGMIGERELKAMKPTAHLINVARGPIVKQEAILKALKEGWIAGAGLDVFEPEPLSPESELWDLPNVIISPHIAGVLERHPAALTDLFCENLKRYFANEKLINLIGKNDEF